VRLEYRACHDISRAVQHAHAADRFAREIVGILTAVAMRLRRLMGRPLGRTVIRGMGSA